MTTARAGPLSPSPRGEPMNASESESARQQIIMTSSADSEFKFDSADHETDPVVTDSAELATLAGYNDRDPDGRLHSDAASQWLAASADIN
jgi:hypothetical protein